MLFGAPELLAHVGNLPLNMPQSFELRGLLERRLEARRDLLHAGIQNFDRCCRHSLTDRTLEPLCHLDQPPVEIRWFLAHRGKPKRRRGVAWFALRLRGTEGRLRFRRWGRRLLQSPRQSAQLEPQPLKRRGLFWCTDDFGDRGAVRDMAEPRLEL